MKAPYSLFNTHIKTVKGMFGVKDSFTRTTVDIRCTSETNRETLSAPICMAFSIPVRSGAR